MTGPVHLLDKKRPAYLPGMCGRGAPRANPSGRAPVTARVGVSKIMRAERRWGAETGNKIAARPGIMPVPASGPIPAHLSLRATIQHFAKQVCEFFMNFYPHTLKGGKRPGRANIWEIFRLAPANPCYSGRTWTRCTGSNSNMVRRVSLGEGLTLLVSVAALFYLFRNPHGLSPALLEASLLLVVVSGVMVLGDLFRM